MNTNFSKEELETERWKPIVGYDGVYEVSSLGRVRSKKSGGEKILRPGKTTNGYVQVVLYKDKKSKAFLVHRLVAEAFVPNDNILNTEVNHINEDKTDNRASNLEYCDRQYNMTYSSKRRKIERLYRPDFTYQQNIDHFKENGIECCEKTVQLLRKDLGITRPHHRIVL